MFVTLLVIVLVYGVVALLAAWRAPGRTAPPDPDALAGARTELLAVTVPTGADDATPLTLDVALYVPDGVDASSQAPAVVLLHGFASDRTAQVGRAAQLVAQGYVVLVPSARGFGASEGRITLADRAREGQDLVALVDLLAGRGEVRQDAPGDPRVALVGASYGGGLALIGASLDARVDTVVAVTAWHDLAAALAPNAVGATSSGPLKVGWTSLLFTARSLDGATGSSEALVLSGGAVSSGDPSARCGRFAPEVCALADRAAIDGRLDADAAELLERARIGRPSAALRPAPTLLVQGRDDTLFGVDAAFANALALEASGAPVRVRLAAGGHAQVGADAVDGPLAAEIDAWLAHWLGGGSIEGAPPFAATGVLVHDALGAPTVLAWPAAILGTGGRTLHGALAPDGQGSLLEARPDPSLTAVRAQLVTPAGGLPAALTSIPGLGAVADLVGLIGLGAVVDVPGQHLALTTAPLDDALLLLGPTTVTLGVAAETGEAQLFVRLASIAPGGRTTIIGSSVAPVRLPAVSTDPDRPTRVGITLPDVVHRVEAGARIRLTVATTDQAFANLREPGSVFVDVSDLQLVLRGPGLDDGAASAAAAGQVASGLLAVTRDAPVVVALPVLILLAALGAAVLARVRRARRVPLASVADRLALAASGPDPVVIRGLVKHYDDGTRAVDGLDLTVRAGQVVGLLGPNGAGKTTTLRMLLGLITPTAGSIELFGQPMRPGHPVLERVGALVEGPGLVPDLSGRDNLALHWRAGGRPMADAHLDWAMSIADLGSAIDRPVRTYSHGMAQRLAIAQALLGRPALLVLDEPTDGLDPEQIRAMRRLLVRLAAEGHTVLVSSHLLAEVEQTCTHAVVVLGGKVVAAGPVSELGARGRTFVVEVDDRARAQVLLAARLGEDRVALEGSGLMLTLERPDESADVVAYLVGAGIAVRTASRRGRLEDAFLQLTVGRGIGSDTGGADADAAGGTAEGDEGAGDVQGEQA